MMKLYAYLAALFAAFGGALALYLKGRNTGKKIQQVKTLETEVKREQTKNETLEKVVDARADVGTLGDAGIDKRLRDKYQRD